MDVALHDRPALTEVLGILALCAVLLAVLAEMDNSAAREYAARAQRALAAAARVAPQPAKAVRAPAPVQVKPRTESLGSRGPISIPVGAAWSPGTSAAVAHKGPSPAPTAPAVVAAPLRRIVGPSVPAHGRLIERAKAPARAAPKRRAARPAAPVAAVASPSRPDRRPSPILAMMAGCGLLMCLSGAVILRSR